MRDYGVFPCLVLCLAAMSAPAAARDRVEVPAGHVTLADPMIAQLELKLTDGSLLKGKFTADHDALPIRTDFGDIAVSWKTVRGFTVSDDRETILVEFINADRITGHIRSGSIPVEGVLGVVNVPWSVVQSAQVHLVTPTRTPETQPLTPVGVRASGSYGQTTPAMAIDGRSDTSWCSGAWGGWIELDLGAVYNLAQIRFELQFSPVGPATHEVYVSDKPIAECLDDARLLKSLSGTRHDHDVLTVHCPDGVKARYIQILCPSSVSWFSIKQVQVIPGE